MLPLGIYFTDSEVISNPTVYFNAGTHTHTHTAYMLERRYARTQRHTYIYTHTKTVI